MKDNGSATSKIKKRILIALVLINCFVAWRFFNSSTVYSHPYSGSLTPQMVIDAVKGNLSKKYTLSNEEVTTFSNNQYNASYSTSSSPLIKSVGYQYYTESATEAGMTLKSGVVMFASSAEAGDRAYEVANQTLLALGLSPGVQVDRFENKDVVCETYSGYIGASNRGMSVNCGLLSGYPSEAQKIKPFADKLPSFKVNSSLTNLNIKPAPVKDYEVAELSILHPDESSPSTAYFYKKSNKEWTYVTSLDRMDNLKCSTFNTEDLKNAFKGRKCANNEYGGADYTVQ